MPRNTEDVSNSQRAAMTYEERKMEVDKLIKEEREAALRLREAKAAHSAVFERLAKAQAFRRSIGEEMTLSTLPNEIQSEILSYLSLRDRVNVRVTRRLHSIEKEARALLDLEPFEGEYTIKAGYDNCMELESANWKGNTTKSIILDFENALHMMKRVFRTRKMICVIIKVMPNHTLSQWKKVFSDTVLSDIRAYAVSISGDVILPFSDLNKFLRTIKDIGKVDISASTEITGNELIQLNERTSKLWNFRLRIVCPSIDIFIKSFFGIDPDFITSDRSVDGIVTTLSDAEIYIIADSSYDYSRVLIRKELTEPKSLTSLCAQHSNTMFTYFVNPIRDLLSSASKIPFR